MQRGADGSGVEGERQDVWGQTHHLGKGDAGALPLHPSRRQVDQGIEPIPIMRSYRQLTPRWEASRSLRKPVRGQSCALDA